MLNPFPLLFSQKEIYSALTKGTCFPVPVPVRILYCNLEIYGFVLLLSPAPFLLCAAKDAISITCWPIVSAP